MSRVTGGGLSEGMMLPIGGAACAGGTWLCNVLTFISEEGGGMAAASAISYSVCAKMGVRGMQEFTGLGRAEAIEMLYQFGGDPNAVMAHLFP